jgi:hypothetical protein
MLYQLSYTRVFAGGTWERRKLSVTALFSYRRPPSRRTADGGGRIRTYVGR